jgi:hypothetical protein
VLLQCLPKGVYNVPQLLPIIFVLRRVIDKLLKHFQSRLEQLVLLDAAFHQTWLLSQLLNFWECDLLFHIMMLLQHLTEHLAVCEQVYCILRTRLGGKRLIVYGIEAAQHGVVDQCHLLGNVDDSVIGWDGLFLEAPVVGIRVKGPLAHFDL